MKDHSLSKTYNFKNTEERIYQWWQKQGYFEPSNDPKKPGFDSKKKPWVLTIPPPNITGELHLGHAMFVSMEDLMTRYNRMRGIPTLWVPGTDHASIATQLQVEKMLFEEGLSREDIGRQAFLERCWEWRQKYGGIITRQIRRLGASCDWSRERFTMDEGLSKAVREAFVRLYEKGLIYRGPRLINWSPGLKTAVSDLEVEYSQEPGIMYYFKYMLVGQEENYIPVATTRPETILGDTAVAVHPRDSRYTDYIGAQVVVPILGRRVPVIADEYVDMEFGTGALKITPGHDPNDYEIGIHHGLDVISVLDEEAKVNENGGPYQGLDRFEARQRLWKDMAEAGLVIKEEPYMLNIPRAQRGGEIVEPMVSNQWFVEMKPLAEPAIKAVQDGAIHIVPEYFEKTYYNWLENIQDWCISRQLWWGHRIPVWYCSDCKEMTVARQDPTECAHCGSLKLEQDPDVLDTWFSSGLWPFSTLGWPDETPDFKYFYPTTMMETGYDILFFWVARMIMSGLEFTGQVPFDTVYLHGLIRDADGRKMSKTAGNVIDPLVVMDELGTDALRFTLLVGSTPGNDMNLSLEKVEANRNFANKVWNAGRFVIKAIDDLEAKKQIGDPDWSLADSWIWACLQGLVRDVDRLFQNYQYGEAGRQIYDFFWGDFADWYIEIAKLQLRKGGSAAYFTTYSLARVLELCLRMLHPFTPFVTEELWGHLKSAVLESPLAAELPDWPEALMIASWPEPRPPESWEKTKVGEFSLVQDIVRSVRNMRSEKKVPPGKRISAVIVSDESSEILIEQRETISALAGIEKEGLSILKTIDSKPENHIGQVVGSVSIYLPLSDLVDKEEERNRLNQDLAEVDTQIIRLMELLGGPFTQKAPPQVVEKERLKLEGFQKSRDQITRQLEELE
jgi:valyl-tRNA synthetase